LSTSLARRWFDQSITGRETYLEAVIMPDRKITLRKWARGSGPGPAVVIGPGQERYGVYPALVKVTVKPRAWICRRWLRILRSVSVRAW
jgi:hypothetical protein